MHVLTIPTERLLLYCFLLRDIEKAAIRRPHVQDWRSPLQCVVHADRRACRGHRCVHGQVVCNSMIEGAGERDGSLISYLVLHRQYRRNPRRTRVAAVPENGSPSPPLAPSQEFKNVKRRSRWSSSNLARFLPGRMTW